MKFSERLEAQRQFELYSKETGALNCASSVFCWLMTTTYGRKALDKLLEGRR